MVGLFLSHSCTHYRSVASSVASRRRPIFTESFPQTAVRSDQPFCTAHSCARQRDRATLERERCRGTARCHQTSGVLSCWPDGLELTPGFYPSGVQRAAQTVLGVYLRRTCSRVTSASSALEVLNDYALNRSAHSLTPRVTSRELRSTKESHDEKFFGCFRIFSVSFSTGTDGGVPPTRVFRLAAGY